jgi:FkbM family methyltransferase
MVVPRRVPKEGWYEEGCYREMKSSEDEPVMGPGSARPGPIGSLFLDVLYNGLVATARVRRPGRRGVPWEWEQGIFRSLESRVWEHLWFRAVRRFAGRPVHALVHGIMADVNFGHPYPSFVQLFEAYNAPLVALVRGTASAIGHRVSVLDVGAGIGDTALLLDSCCHDCLRDVVAVEGDPKFCVNLRANLARIDAPTSVIEVLLSECSGPVPALVSVHHGTASLKGDDQAVATTLDDLWRTGKLGRLDVMKVDVDGFDGRVLAGGRELLASLHPSVIFEWSPPHLAATGNSPHQPFEVLMGAGYEDFIWSDKFGRVTHTNHGIKPLDVEALQDISLHSKVLPDWHYGVVALPSGSDVSLVALAGLEGAARDRRSVGRGRHRPKTVAKLG